MTRLPLGLAQLLRWNLGLCVAFFALLEIWRPCYFLTDDNLSSLFPVFTEIGRHLKSGQSPFVNTHLFGGAYDLSRDPGFLYWHPFYLLPCLLADTFARFWILDVIAFLLLLLATTGFTLLAARLRDEFNPELPAFELCFITQSYIFSTFILTSSASWINFLGNEGALPWLVWGIFDRRLWRGVSVIAVVTIHQMLSGFAGLTLSTEFFLTLFAIMLALGRRSPVPFLVWCVGSAIGFLVLLPFLAHVLAGFAQSSRAGGVTALQDPGFEIPALIFPSSLFFGNWAQPLAFTRSYFALKSFGFPFVSTLLACAAAWCILPVAVDRKTRWRYPDVAIVAVLIFLAVWIIRPERITEVMHQLPVLRSLRWPFRESLEFLFFFHVLLVLRFRADGLMRPAILCSSFAAFVLPLPFDRVPTYNPFSLDRKLVLSGEAEAFWNKERTLLKPDDQIATVIDLDLWKASTSSIPYTLLGTANYPALFGVVSVEGYSTTVPLDQVPIKIPPHFWYGAFTPGQVPALLKERPNVRLVRIVQVNPLKITLTSADGQPIDLSGDIPPDVRGANAPAQPTGKAP